jgi:pimeloyl-ACP methyl ester carboxylesterase
MSRVALDFPLFSSGAPAPAPAVLLIHGGGSTSEPWVRVARQLPEHLRVLRYDRPTYRSPQRSGADAMAAEVADVLAIADAAPDPLVVVGHSSGAVVALQSTLAAPSRFAGLVLYEPPLSLDTLIGGEPLRRARAALDAGRPGRAISIHMRQIVGMPAVTVLLLRLVFPAWLQLRRYAPGQIADDEALESLGLGVQRYAAIEVPVLLLGGQMSPPHLRDRLAALGAVLPHAETVIMPRRGHTANVTAPGEVAGIIAAFADRVLGS